jgi:hypothetical protein
MCAQTVTLGKADALPEQRISSRERWLVAGSRLRKCSGYHLLGLVGIPLIAAVCLLIQLHKLPESSLSYSLLNAIVSVLFNFSSSALLNHDGGIRPDASAQRSKRFSVVSPGKVDA